MYMYTHMYISSKTPVVYKYMYMYMYMYILGPHVKVLCTQRCVTSVVSVHTGPTLPSISVH